MRKSLLIVLILLITATNVSAGKQPDREMSGLAELVKDSDLEIDSWQVTIREQMDRNRIEQLIEKINSKNSHKVTGEEDENTIKYSFRHVQKGNGFTETYNVLIPKDKNYQAQFTVVLKGKAWTNDVEESYFMRLEFLKKTYFSGNSTKFACLTTAISDKIEIGSFFAKMTESLNVQNRKMQIDNQENSTINKLYYGYTPLWNNHLNIIGEPMNLQIAVLEEESGLAKLVIGTPILINEY